jgi:hypothetical protein
VDLALDVAGGEHHVEGRARRQGARELDVERRLDRPRHRAGTRNAGCRLRRMDRVLAEAHRLERGAQRLGSRRVVGRRVDGLQPDRRFRDPEKPEVGGEVVLVDPPAEQDHADALPRAVAVRREAVGGGDRPGIDGRRALARPGGARRGQWPAVEPEDGQRVAGQRRRELERLVVGEDLVGTHRVQAGLDAKGAGEVAEAALEPHQATLARPEGQPGGGGERLDGGQGVLGRRQVELGPQPLAAVGGEARRPLGDDLGDALLPRRSQQDAHRVRCLAIEGRAGGLRVVPRRPGAARERDEATAPAHRRLPVPGEARRRASAGSSGTVIALDLLVVTARRRVTGDCMVSSQGQA